MKQRDNYWDTLKWVLMALVVFGHVLGAAPYPAGSAKLAVSNCIYLFHMPLFIFVSGRFSVVHDRRRYLRGILRLLETYLVFQLLLGALNLYNGETTLSTALTCPYFALWYLMSLIGWRLLVLMIPPNWLMRRKVLSVAIGFAISLIAGMLPVGKAFSLQRTLAFLPFFMAGYVSANLDVKAFVKRIPLPVALLLIAVPVALVVHYNCRMGLFLRHTLYYSFPYNMETGIQLRRCLLTRGICLTAAVMASIGIMRLVGSAEQLAQWGRSTLFIYIAHIFIVKYLLTPALTQGLLPDGIGWLAGYSLLALLLLSLIAQARWSAPLLNPLSSLCSRRQRTAA